MVLAEAAQDHDGRGASRRVTFSETQVAQAEREARLLHIAAMRWLLRCRTPPCSRHGSASASTIRDEAAGHAGHTGFPTF